MHWIASELEAEADSITSPDLFATILPENSRLHLEVQLQRPIPARRLRHCCKLSDDSTAVCLHFALQPQLPGR
jgi:hypothetical protein